MSKISIPKFVFLASKVGKAKSPDKAPPVPGSEAISSCSSEIGGGGESSSGGGSSSSGSGGGGGSSGGGGGGGGAISNESIDSGDLS